MATGTVQPAAKDTTAEVQPLQWTIQQTDFLAQERLASISSVAQLALVALRQQQIQPNVRSWEAIAQALITIAEDAEDLMDTINAAAEKVGCNFKAEVRHG